MAETETTPKPQEETEESKKKKKPIDPKKKFGAVGDTLDPVVAKDIEKEVKRQEKEKEDAERKKLIESGDRTEAFIRIKIGGSADKKDKPKDKKGEEDKDGDEENEDEDTEDGENTEDDEDNPLAPEDADGDEANEKAADESQTDKEDEDESKKGVDKKGEKIDPKKKFGAVGDKLDAEVAKDIEEEIKRQRTKLESEGDDGGPRELFFDSRRGEVIVQAGTPYVRLSTYQHSTAKFIIYDPDDTIRPMIWKRKNVEIEIGFVNGYSVNKFVGIVYSCGRWLPNGCIVEAVDPSFEEMSAQGAGLVATNTGEAAGEDEYEILDTFTGKASILKAEDDNTALESGKELTEESLFGSHIKLDFGAKVRLTNPATKKTAIITIESRSVDSASAIDVTEKVFELLEAKLDELPLDIKAEVLGKKKEKTSEDEEEEDKEKEGEEDENNTDEKPPEPDEETGRTEPNSNANNTQRRTSVAEEAANAQGNVQFENNGTISVPRVAEAVVGASIRAVAEREAAAQGNVITTTGNKMEVTGPGQAKPSGVVLNYKQNPAAFIRHPTIIQRTNVALQNGYGGVRVVGADALNKTTQEAIALTTASAGVHGTGSIKIPGSFKEVKVADPIIGAGGRYTWGDATKGGSRVPTDDIMGNIVGIAKALEEITDKHNGGSKFTVTSWYRPPAANAGGGGVSGSRHLTGDAIDFAGGAWREIYNILNAEWPGGVGDGRHKGFVHIDNRHLYGKPKGRWGYP